MFECPICLEQTEHDDSGVFKIFFYNTEYSVCPFCYHVIQTLRKKKNNFEVEIQKW